MPAYRYRCKDCASRFRVHATIREMEEGTASKFACPSCGSRAVRRVFSVGGFLVNVFRKEQDACCGGGSCCSSPEAGKAGENACCGSSSCS